MNLIIGALIGFAATSVLAALSVRALRANASQGDEVMLRAQFGDEWIDFPIDASRSEINNRIAAYFEEAATSGR